jgi:hypothetical protein
LLFANSRENSAKLKHSNTTCRPGGMKLSISAWILCKTFLFPLLFWLTFFEEKNFKTRSWICVQYFSFFVPSLLISQFARQKTSKPIAWIVFFSLIALLSSLLICSLQKKKTSQQEHELLCRLISLCLLLFRFYRFFAKKKTKKQEHELFAYLFLFVFS